MGMFFRVTVADDVSVLNVEIVRCVYCGTTAIRWIVMLWLGGVSGGDCGQGDGGVVVVVRGGLGGASPFS